MSHRHQPPPTLTKEQQEKRDRLIDALNQVAKILQDDDLKCKDAKCMNRFVSFFRGKQLLELIEKNSDKVKSAMSEFYKGELEAADDYPKFLSFLLHTGFMVKLERGEDSEIDGKKLKWPKKLNPPRSQAMTFEKMSFYSWRGLKKPKMASFLTFGIVFAVIAACLFPVWPLQLKIGLWYLSVFLLLIMTAIIIVRLVLYIAIWIFGFDFWLFPDLFHEEKGPIESFKPLFSGEYRGDSWTMMFGRLMLLGILVAAGYQVGQEPETITDFTDASYDTINDIVDWGYLKLTDGLNSTDVTMKDQYKRHYEELTKDL
eukprot:CAMPEP_0115009068 /NCGR_PEP_ID=MMETSP0216-20121206/22357_1 /TAXON_ID=223996 /ORGANISM="Protocruzia adherens, Strain Boccale" /LENGTH=314 /DNA_ID=CAMNT_0002376735 /DNA_START=176 /DNA_END=1120 /DNA_ORIENTATION=-